MSIALMTKAWALDVSSTDKLVLLALADWSNEDGRCWPSMAKLAKKSGLTDRAIRISVGRLRDAGHLTREENPGKGVVYTVHPGTSFPPEADAPRKHNPETPERRSANTLGTIIPQKATPSSGKRASKGTPVPMNFVPNPAANSLTAKAMADWPPGELAEQVEHFIDCHTAKGTISKDWDASWRTWVKNWKKFNGNRPHHNRPNANRRSSEIDDAARSLGFG